MASTTGANTADQSVRFSENNEEISPEPSYESSGGIKRGSINAEAEEELRQLKTSLQNGGLQSKRMEHYSFEPVSLPGSQPVSRVRTTII